MFFVAGPVEQAATFRAFQVSIPAEREASVGFGNLNQVQDVLEQAVAGDGWLAGDGFTMADLHVAATLGWATAFGMLDMRPAYKTFLERCMDRPRPCGRGRWTTYGRAEEQGQGRRGSAIRPSVPAQVFKELRRAPRPAQP